MGDKMLNNKNGEARYLSYEEIPYVLDASKVTQVLGLPRTTVIELMKMPGFPVISFGKAKIVKKDDLFAWLDRSENRDSPNTNQQNKKKTNRRKSI